LSRSDTGRFTVVCTLIALGSGAAVLAYALPRGEEVVRWSGLGWLIMAVIGVAAGIWMVRVHGRPGSGFMAALVTGMLARMLVAAAVALVAAQQGIEIVWAYLVGLFTGYLPLQVFELTWFLRKDRNRT